jgi:hypothetical protein
MRYTPLRSRRCAARSAQLIEEGRQINTCQHAVLDEDPTIHHRVQHVIGAARVHQCRRRIVARCAVRRVQVDDDQVRELSGLERTRLRQVHGPGRIARRHVEHVLHGQELRVEVVVLVRDGAELHLLEHVQGIVAGWTIGREADGHARLAKLANRHDARTQLGVADRAVRHLHPVLGEERDVRIGQRRAVGSRQSRAQQAHAVQPCRRRAAVLFSDVAVLLLTLGEVRVDGQVVLLGHLGAAPPELLRTRVGGVG